MKYSIDELMNDLQMLNIEVVKERRKLFDEKNYEMIAHNTGKMWMLDFIYKYIESRKDEENGNH